MNRGTTKHTKSTKWEGLKAVKTLLPEHSAQLLNYLKATDMRLGLLVNFCNVPGVDIKRIAN